MRRVHKARQRVQANASSIPAVREFGPGLRIAVMRVQRRDKNAIYSGFDIPTLFIAGTPWKGRMRYHGFSFACENRYAIPRFLTPPNRPLASLFNCRDRELSIRSLNFLKARYLGARHTQPVQEVFEPLVDVVDVERCYLHAATQRECLRAAVLNQPDVP